MLSYRQTAQTFICPFTSIQIRRTAADSEREDAKLSVDKVRKRLSESVHLLTIFCWKDNWWKIMCSCRRCVNRWTLSSRSFSFASNSRSRSLHLLSHPRIPQAPRKPLTREEWPRRKEKAILNHLNRWTEKWEEWNLETQWDWCEETCTRGLLLHTKKRELKYVFP